jgi:hypothetical protein
MSDYDAVIKSSLKLKGGPRISKYVLDRVLTGIGPRRRRRRWWRQ